jgi:Family of unknown function (DUF6314)
MVINDTLGFLTGRWNLTRLLEDHRSGIAGSFEGRAVLAGAPPGNRLSAGARAHYQETGELRFGCHHGPAHRSLEYIRLDNATVMLHFADGRPFTDLDLSTGAWRATHLCGADHYEITTFVRTRDVVQEHWRVRGPAKDYDAIANLSRTG